MTPALTSTCTPAQLRRNGALAVIYAVEPLLAVLAIIAVAPVALVIAAVIAASARACPLIAHRRVGQDGNPFWMLKFRTMSAEPHRHASFGFIERVEGVIPASKLAHDPRIIKRFAAWCRRYSVDELPQLLHIACGQMSFVGPRPITQPELDRWYGASASEVLFVRPGLTGLWQVTGRSRLTYEERRTLDLQFVRSASAALYFRILLRSLPVVLTGTDAC